MSVDYVVVGAGSAGCVVACRLVQSGARVALLEAGPRDRDPRIHVPAALRPLLYDPKVNWNFSAEPTPGAAGRRIGLPRGRVLGGSSSINGMLYVRGNPADYDGWAQRGCRGWSYDDVLPLFKRSETFAGGTYNSPQLLQVSGIGPAAHLASIGVEVRHNLPGVGANLADHFGARIKHRVHGEMTMNQLSRFPHVVPEIAKYLLFGRGALTFGVTSAMVFARSREGLASPDLQLSFTPATPKNEAQGALEKEPGITITVLPVRAQSRGTVMAASADPYADPVVRPCYLEDESDVSVLHSGVQMTRRIFDAPALKSVSLGEYAPGADAQTRDEIRQYTQQTGGTIHHPVGTCKMGTDPNAVVDPRLRVHGIAGLRVVDASIMPTLTTGNTNAPAIMIGEKGAQMIIEDA